MIEVEGLTRITGGRRILDGVSFRVGPGEVVGFLGPNGAGKTTTLRVLAGALPPGGGTVRVAGDAPPLESAASRRRVGYLPENVPVVGRVSALEYVAFAGRARGRSRAGADHEAREHLADVGLADAASRPVRELSKGERQRVGLAAALAGDPDVLLLDEPTSGLDPAQLVTVRELIRRQQGRRAVLFSTHLLGEVASTCDRVVVLHAGRVVAERPTGRSGAESARNTVEVTLRGPREGLEDLVGGVDGIRVLGAESDPAGDGVTLRLAMEGDRRAALARAVVEAGRELLALRRRETPLEEMYLELVAGAGTPRSAGDAG